MFLIDFVFHTVNGTEFKEIYIEYDNGTCDHIRTEVQTPHCGWKEHDVNPTCTKGCDTDCLLCREFFDEVGIEY